MVVAALVNILRNLPDSRTVSVRTLLIYLAYSF